MDKNRIQRNIAKVETPCFIIDERAIEANLKILDSVQKKTGCKILLALKAYATFKTFPIIRKYLNGVCASGLNEAKLGFEEFKKEVHTFAPAFNDKEFNELMKKKERERLGIKESYKAKKVSQMLRGE